MAGFFLWLLAFLEPAFIYLSLLCWATFAAGLSWRYTLAIPYLRKQPLWIAIYFAFFFLPHPPAQAFFLNKTQELVSSCILNQVPGLNAIGNILFTAVRALFVFAVIGIVYMLWQKRQQNEDISEWMRNLAQILLGVGLITVFETLLIGGAAACTGGGLT